MDIKRITEALLKTVSDWLEPQLLALEQRMSGVEAKALDQAAVQRIAQEIASSASAVAVSGIQLPDIDTLVKLDQLRGIESKVEEALHERSAAIRAEIHDALLKHLNEAIESIRPPRDGKDADLAVVRELITAAVTNELAARPVPHDGKDADPEQIRAIVVSELAKIPAPRDVDMFAVKDAILSAVKAEFESLPAPRDGKDADLAVVRELITATVTNELAARPVPRDGKDADLSIVRELIAATVTNELAARPLPRDGKDSDTDAIQEVLLSHAVRSFDTLRAELDARVSDEAISGKLLPLLLGSLGEILQREQDGILAQAKSFIADEVDRALARIPAARDGKDIDLAVLKELVSATVSNEVIEKICAIAPQSNQPAQPAQIDYTLVKELIAAAVTNEVAARPLPLDGRDADPADIDRVVSAAVEPILLRIEQSDSSADSAADEVALFVDEVIGGLTEDDGSSVSSRYAASQRPVNVNVVAGGELHYTAQPFMSSNLSEQLAGLRDTMMMPVVPVFDKNGKLIGSQRLAPSQPGGAGAVHG